MTKRSKAPITASAPELFDVVAVDLNTKMVRVLDTSKDAENAEAIWKMAVMRRGVEEEFFAAVPSGKYKEGDIWEGR